MGFTAFDESNPGTLRAAPRLSLTAFPVPSPGDSEILRGTALEVNGAKVDGQTSKI
jgi:hypothetical protein